MDLKEIEKVVASIQTHLFRNSNSFSVGMLKSHFKGAGLQFKEHQVYNPGDDVRFIDWNMSAKTNSTFVKTFEEERNIEIYAILDITQTMFVGYKNVSKLQAAIEIICLLHLLAQKSKDKVAVVLVSDKITMLPVSSGQEGITLLISQLEKIGVLNEKGKVNLFYENNLDLDEKKKLSVLKSLIAKRKEVVYLSDFTSISNKEQFEKLLYMPNMHCFKVESPLDNLSKSPYLIFAKQKSKSRYFEHYQKKKDQEIQGRYKKINVKDRYLESFVREML